MMLFVRTTRGHGGPYIGLNALNQEEVLQANFVKKKTPISKIENI